MVPTFEYPISSAKGLQGVRNSFPCPGRGQSGMDAFLLLQERVAVMAWDALPPVQASTSKEMKPVRGCHILIPSFLSTAKAMLETEFGLNEDSKDC